MSAASSAARPTGAWGRFGILYLIQMARLRSAWRPYLIVSSAMPLGIAVLLRAVMQPGQIERYGTRIVAGSAVLAIAMTAIVMLAQRMTTLKETRALELFATLPVARGAVVASVLVSFSVFALPGTVIVVTLGALLFGLSLQALWVVVPVWALGSFALSGLGAAIGFAARDDQLAGMYSNIVMMAVLFLGILPPPALPNWIAPLRAILPSTYAIDVLEPGLRGALGTGALWDLLILVGYGLVSYLLVSGPLWPEGD